jgi:hypothetical protein
VIGRGERREIRAAGRPMPDHHGLPQGEHDPEHHAQHGDGTDAPDGGGSTVVMVAATHIPVTAPVPG